MTDHIVDRVKKLQEKTESEHSGPGFMYGLDTALLFLVFLPFSAPLAVALLLGSAIFGAVYGAIGLKLSFTNTHMPDDWLTQIAEHPEISREGIEELSKIAKRQGHITLAQAMAWVENESARKEKSAHVSSEGVKKLIERAAAQAKVSSLLEKAQSAGLAAGEFALDLISIAGGTLGAATRAALSAFTNKLFSRSE